MFEVKTNKLKTLRPTDKDFILQDNFVFATRAGIEVNQDCPKYYKAVIYECINNGWLTPIAVVKDNQLFWDEFSK